MSSIIPSWSVVVIIILLQSVNGTNSNFPAYSSQLKQHLSLSQVQLNNLAFASDFGKLFCFLSGMAANHLPLSVVLIIGSILGLIGYGLQYLAIKFHIAFLLTYPSIFVLTSIAGNSICWINTVCLVVIFRRFSCHGHVAIGIITSYQGLSAKIYTDIVRVAFSSAPGKRAQHYILLNSILPMVVCTIAVVVLLALKIDVGRPTGTRVEFLSMFVIIILTGIYSVISSTLTSEISPLVNVICIGLLLLAPLIVIPTVEKIREKFVAKLDRNTDKRVPAEKNIDDDVDRIEKGVKEGEEDDKKAPDQVGLKLMLQRLDFWLYIFVYFLGATLGLVFLNNLGQIAESRGYLGTALVSLSASFGFFGRFIPSLIDYNSRYVISRPALVAVFMASMSGAFFLLLSGSNISLIIGTIIIGVCTGAITSITVCITTDLFGKENFAVNHNVVIANIPIGSLIFGNLAAFIYHREGNGDGKCMGMECYRNTFIIWGSLCVLGTFLALVLYARTRKFYSQLADKV